jgi:hypothetical protein
MSATGNLGDIALAAKESTKATNMIIPAHKEAISIALLADLTSLNANARIMDMGLPMLQNDHVSANPSMDQMLHVEVAI